MKNKVFVISITLCIIWGCNQKGSSNSKYLDETDSVENIDISVDEENMLHSEILLQKDSIRKFTKSADITMEVDSLYPTTLKIEKKLMELDGFILNSSIDQEIVSENKKVISDDEILLSRKVHTTADIYLRVPQENLYNLVVFIGEQGLFLNNRTFLAEDVTLKLLYNKDNYKRLNTDNQQLNAYKDDEKNGLEAHKMIIENRKEQLDNSFIDAQLKDDIQFSTVRISLSEFPKNVQLTIPNNKSMGSGINFGYQCKMAIIRSWNALQYIGVGLVYIWPILLVGIGVFIYKKYR